MARNAALRRAVAKFCGLLRDGRNRKKRLVPDTRGPLDLAGEIALMINRLIVPLTLAVLSATASSALAQGAFPAPLPGQQAAAPASDSAFPPVNGAKPMASVGAAPASPFPSAGVSPVMGGGGSFAPAPPSQMGGGGGGGPSQACMNGFLPLREDAEKKGKAIKAASDRHASPEEACNAFHVYSAAEVKMIKYVETNATKCGIPPSVADQLKAGHRNTEGIEKKVCTMAEQVKTRGPAGPSLSDVLGSATAMPEATASRKGGSTFDTLNGNVLSR